MARVFMLVLALGLPLGLLGAQAMAAERGVSPLLEEALFAGKLDPLADWLRNGGRVGDLAFFDQPALVGAIRYRNLPLVRLLLDHGASPVSDAATDTRPLHEVCNNWSSDPGLVECLEVLLAAGADANESRSDGTTVLHRLALAGEVEAMALLVSRGADAGLRDSGGHDSLAMLVRHGLERAGAEMPQAIDLLVSAGGDKQAFADRARAWGHVAVAMERAAWATAQELLDKGFPAVPPGGEPGQVFMALAASMTAGDGAVPGSARDLSRLLLALKQAGQDHSEGLVGDRPLFLHAVESGATGLALVLLGLGHDPWSGLPRDGTVLEAFLENRPAAWTPAEDRVHEALTRTGLPIPLTVLFQEDKDLPLTILTFHLRAGADLEKADQAGRTAFHLAVEQGRRDAAGALLDAGARIDAPDHNGLRPLHLAPDRAMAAALLARGADIDARNQAGVTPLFMCIWDGDAARMDLLLEEGADPAALLEDGSNALLWLVRGSIGGSEGVWQLQSDPDLVVRMAVLLLDRGCSPTVRDAGGSEALLLALRSLPDHPVTGLLSSAVPALELKSRQDLLAREQEDRERAWAMESLGNFLLVAGPPLLWLGVSIAGREWWYRYSPGLSPLPAINSAATGILGGGVLGGLAGGGAGLGLGLVLGEGSSGAGAMYAGLGAAALMTAAGAGGAILGGAGGLVFGLRGESRKAFQESPFWYYTGPALLSAGTLAWFLLTQLD